MRCRSAVAGSNVPCSWSERSVFATRILTNTASCFVIGWFLTTRGQFLRMACDYTLLTNPNSERWIVQANLYVGGGILVIRVGNKY